MRRDCKHTVKSAAVAGAMAAVFLTSNLAAQGMPGWIGGPPPELMRRLCDNRDAMFQGRMAFILAKIALKPEQKTAWDQFVATARAVESAFDPCKDGPPPVGDPVALRTRLDQMLEKAHEVHRIMKAAADKLSSALDPEQQRKLAEALLPPSGMGLPMLSMPGFR